MDITKNRQSNEILRAMSKRAFPEKEMLSCKELTEGMCNTAYLVTFTDGSKSVVKIAGNNKEGLMSNEINLMRTEVEAMKIVEESGLVRIAKVEFYDTTHEVCDGDYFFMEALEGDSHNSIREQLTEEEHQVIYKEVGEIVAKISTIQGKGFGFLGEERRFDTLFDYVYLMMKNVIDDAKRKNVAFPVSGEEILSQLKADRSIFDEVTKPVLVHWDIWEGNVFVKDKHVVGIIDWERAMWAEPFLEAGFRLYSKRPEFLMGYGQTEFTNAELRRLSWYDAFLFLTMIIEGAYRIYADDSQARWVTPLFLQAWNTITSLA